VREEVEAAREEREGKAEKAGAGAAAPSVSISGITDLERSW